MSQKTGREEGPAGMAKEETPSPTVSSHPTWALNVGRFTQLQNEDTTQKGLSWLSLTPHFSHLYLPAFLSPVISSANY